MARSERKDLILKLQNARKDRLLVVYITSTRTGHELQIADDAFRLIFDHLESGKELATKGVDLFIHSNGGSGTVPWRIVTLIRQYTKHFAVLVPHRAFSAATLMALGADEIVMHKMGCLGPIDPSVSNIFIPPHPYAPGQPATISVEDVSAFFKLVKDEVGITHEDELIQALTALTEKIHPLALGNVQRSHNQSRLLARKLLRLHMINDSQEHEIELLIDTLKSNLFFHGHPINREEAKNDLKLKVTIPEPAIEALMWQLYLEYEGELKLLEPFNAVRELELKLQALGSQQVPVLPLPQGPGNAPVGQRIKLDPIQGAFIESAARVHVFKTDLRLERSIIGTQMGPQEVVKTEMLWQRWEEEHEETKTSPKRLKKSK